MIQSWMIQKEFDDKQITYFEEKDPYFRTHKHFEGDQVTLKEIFPRKGSLYFEIVTEMPTLLSCMPESTTETVESSTEVATEKNTNTSSEDEWVEIKLEPM